MAGEGPVRGVAPEERARVVLVRPWVDAHAGGGCCSGDTRDAVALDRPVCRVTAADDPAHLVGAAYRLLRERLPEVDVQVVSVSNTAYLLPSTFRAARRRQGMLTAVRTAVRATTAGAVLVDGERVGDVEDLGPDEVLAAVRRRLPTPLS